MEDIETEAQELAKILQSYALQAAYGGAMLKANRLEFGLRTLLSMHINTNSDDEFDKAMSKLKGLPLGRLVNRANQEFSIPAYWQDELENLCWFRNQLAHLIVDDISWSRLWEEDEWELISHINEIGGLYGEALDYISSMIDTEAEARGLSKESLVEFRDMISRHIEHTKQNKRTTRE